jgi:hypothetical protein
MMYYIATNQNSGSIVIRGASPADAAALRRVAERDSRAVPDGQLLLAEVDGETQAAIALATGEVIADPFRPTAELVQMLALRRSLLQADLRRSSRPAASPALSPRLS